MRATTVHSALGWIPGEGPTHDEQDPLALRPADRRRDLDGQPRAAGHAAAGGRTERARGAGRRRRPARAGRRRQAVRRAGRLGRGADRPPHPHLPPGRRQHDRPGRPRDPPRRGARLQPRGGHAPRPVPDRAGRPAGRAARRSSRWSAERLPAHYGDRSGPRHPGVRAGVPGRARDRRAQRGAARDAEPRRPARPRRPPADRRQADDDRPQPARARADERNAAAAARRGRPASGRR